MLTVFIIGSASLGELNFGGNLIGDNGILLVSSELQSNSNLTELRLYDCGISVKGTWLVVVLRLQFKRLKYSN